MGGAAAGLFSVKGRGRESCWWLMVGLVDLVGDGDEKKSQSLRSAGIFIVFFKLTTTTYSNLQFLRLSVLADLKKTIKIPLRPPLGS